MPEEIPTAEPVKGWKTSEFWVLVAGSLVAILNKAFDWNIPNETVISIIGGISAYIIGRSLVKKPVA